MNLYFYMLRKRLEVKECEALKRNGLIRPTEGFFPMGRGSYIIESDIGKAKEDNFGGTPFVILNEPNMEKAKQILTEQYIDVKIGNYKKKIACLEEKRKVILEAKEGE